MVVPGLPGAAAALELLFVQSEFFTVHKAPRACLMEPAVTPLNETHDLVAVCTLLPCCSQEVQSNVASVLVPDGVAVQHVQPARVTQYIRTQLTVVLNGSLCDQLGQVRALLGPQACQS